MTKKQNFYFNLLLPVYISITLGFIMTSIHEGFTETFLIEYLKSIIIGIVVTTPLGFSIVGDIAKATFKHDPPTRIEHILFHLYLALMMTGIVTLVSNILAGTFTLSIDFFMGWVKSWSLALLFCWIIIHFSLPVIEKLITTKIQEI